MKEKIKEEKGRRGKRNKEEVEKVRQEKYVKMRDEEGRQNSGPCGEKSPVFGARSPCPTLTAATGLIPPDTSVL